MTFGYSQLARSCRINLCVKNYQNSPKSQELWKFSLTDHRLTDTNVEYSAHLVSVNRTVGRSIFLWVVQFRSHKLALTLSAMQPPHHYITKTHLYNADPLQPHFYTGKPGFTGVYIIFLISAQNHRLWVLVRTASTRRF